MVSLMGSNAQKFADIQIKKLRLTGKQKKTKTRGIYLMIKLSDYVTEYFGTQKEFAKHIGTPASNVSYMVRRGYIVIDNILYSPKRKIGKVCNENR